METTIQVVNGRVIDVKTKATAVILDEEYGQWSTSAYQVRAERYVKSSDRETQEAMLFDPVLIRGLLLEAPTIMLQAYMDSQYAIPRGPEGLAVEWIRPGEIFRVMYAENRGEYIGYFPNQNEFFTT